jgi:CBS domain-containing protein
MTVEKLLPVAHGRLIVIGSDAAVIDAARHLASPHMHLLVVCDRTGKAAGVMSKMDVVKHISSCQGNACRIAVSAVMTHEIVACRPDDRLRDVWTRMKTRSVQCVPVLSSNAKPLGVLYARDVLETLLTEVEDEEALLRDYVMSVGFH